MKTIGYIRVSTEDQVSGHSLENQEERIRSYCKYKEFQLIKIIEDAGISGGKNNDRNGFISLLKLMEKGDFNNLVIYSLERLSRDMFTLLSLERLCNIYKISLHTIEGSFDTSTPTGFMQFSMQALLAEIERRTVIYRTKNIMQANKKKNKVVGNIPYGFKREGDKLIENPPEIEIINEVNQMYSKGKKLSQIAVKLTQEGKLSRKGKPFSGQQLKRMIEGYEDIYKKINTKELEMAKLMKEVLLFS